jgi:hypothetical protein
MGIILSKTEFASDYFYSVASTGSYWLRAEAKKPLTTGQEYALKRFKMNIRQIQTFRRILTYFNIFEYG